MPIFHKAGYFKSKHYFHENKTPLRQVEYYELELVEQGNGFSFLDGEQFAHLPQRLILARPGTQRFTVGTFSCQFVHFFAQSTKEAALLNALSFSAIADSPLIRGMMLEIERLQHEEGPEAFFSCQAALCGLLAQAAALLNGAPSVNHAMDPHFSAVLSVKEFMDQHFGDKINLEHLAEQAHLSKNFFRTKFSQLMGLSPREYLSQVRLTYAQKLLRTSSQSIAHIAAQCGYESQAYFTYSFKRHTGKTPLEYRRFAWKKNTLDSPSKA